MKYLLIAFLIKEFTHPISPPWATSAVAEFNTLDACKNAAAQITRFNRRYSATVEWVCVEKGAEPALEAKPPESK